MTVLLLTRTNLICNNLKGSIRVGFWCCAFTRICFSIISQNIGILSRAFRQQFIIPDFEGFVKNIEEMYWKCKSNTEGKVKTAQPLLNYTPTLFLFVGSQLYTSISPYESKLLGCQYLHDRRPKIFNRRRQHPFYPTILQ